MRGRGKRPQAGELDNFTMTKLSGSSNGTTTEITYKVSAPNTANEPESYIEFFFSNEDAPDNNLDGTPDDLAVDSNQDRVPDGFTKIKITREPTIVVQENEVDVEYTVHMVKLSLDPSSNVTLVDFLPPSRTNDRSVEFDVKAGTLGTPKNDVLTGTEGNDYIKGYGGKKNEVDILTGDSDLLLRGADTFVLGELNSQGQSNFGNSYQGTGHAVITDFEIGKDTIQLLNRNNIIGSGEKQPLNRSGKNGDYYLRKEELGIGASGIIDSGAYDTAIYYKSNNNWDRIAYVRDVNLTVRPDAFTSAPQPS